MQIINYMASIPEVDGNILLWIQDHLRNDFLSNFFIPYTKLGNHGELWIFLLLASLVFAQSRKTGLIGIASLVATFLINDMGIKAWVARLRPYLVVEGLNRLVEAEKSFSFPSGHAATAFAVAYLMFRQLPLKFGLPILVLAILMAFSRLYVGVHYPTDVLVGSAIGIGLGEICVGLEARIWPKPSLENQEKGE